MIIGPWWEVSKKKIKYPVLHHRPFDFAGRCLINLRIKGFNIFMHCIKWFFNSIFSLAILEHFRAARLSKKFIYNSHLGIIVFNAVGYISVTKPFQTIHLFHNIPLWSLLHSGIRMSHLRSLWHRWLCVDKVTKSKVTVEKQSRKMVYVLWNAGVHESANPRFSVNPVRIRLSINFSWYRNTSYDSI